MSVRIHVGWVNHSIKKTNMENVPHSAILKLTNSISECKHDGLLNDCKAILCNLCQLSLVYMKVPGAATY